MNVIGRRPSITLKYYYRGHVRRPPTWSSLEHHSPMWRYVTIVMFFCPSMTALMFVEINHLYLAWYNVGRSKCVVDRAPVWEETPSTATPSTRFARGPGRTARRPACTSCHLGWDGECRAKRKSSISSPPHLGDPGHIAQGSIMCFTRARINEKTTSHSSRCRDEKKPSEYDAIVCPLNVIVIFCFFAFSLSSPCPPLCPSLRNGGVVPGFSPVLSWLHPRRRRSLQWQPARSLFRA